MVLQSIPFMASGCSLVRRAGRLHFIGRHLRDRHHNAPQFEVGGRSPPQRPRRRAPHPPLTSSHRRFAE
jgi:ribosomal protein L36